MERRPTQRPQSTKEMGWPHQLARLSLYPTLLISAQLKQSSEGDLAKPFGITEVMPRY